jgi:hypothetical protein
MSLLYKISICNLLDKLIFKFKQILIKNIKLI